MKDWEDYADGRILSGKKAHEYGFVDELGNFEIAVERAKALSGVSDADLIMYQMPMRFGNFLKLLGQTSSRGLKIDLGLPLPQILAGRPYFIAPSLMP